MATQFYLQTSHHVPAQPQSIKCCPLAVTCFASSSLPPFLPTYIPPCLTIVDSIRGFAHAAGFAAARRCLPFLVSIKIDYKVVCALSNGENRTQSMSHSASSGGLQINVLPYHTHGQSMAKITPFRYFQLSVEYLNEILHISLVVI